MRAFTIFRSLIYTLLVAAILVPGAAAQDQELPLGSSFPGDGLQLTTTDGQAMAITGAMGAKGTAVIFWSNQCPWVDKYEDRLVKLAGTYADAGIAFVAVNANDPNAFPNESAAESRKRAVAVGDKVTFLMDGGSRLAKALGASRTPHVFVFDANQTLVYVGTLDDSPGDPGNVSKTYLSDALDAVVAGQAVAVPKTKAFGCTLKPQS